MNIQILTDRKIPLYDGGIVQPFKVYLEPENRFAVIQVITGLFVAVRIESLDQELLVGRYIDHIYDSMDDIMMYKHDVDWSCIQYGFFKLTCWAPELANEHNGSFTYTVKRFYFDKELYEKKYKELNHIQ